MPSRPRFDAAQRRARLASRHRLAADAKADTPGEVADSLVALHGTDPSSVYLAILARSRQPDAAAIEDVFYERRSLLRLLAMRRTMFVVTTDTAPIVQAACGDAIAVQQRKRLLQFLAEADVAADPEKWLSDVENSTLRALAKRGCATAAQLSEDEPRLRTPLLLAQDKPYAAKQNVVTRVLLVLSAEGRIVRGRPRGSWTSSQYAWWPTESWLTAPIPAMPADTARVELVRRWLAAFGPGTAEDLKWWTGLTMGQIRKALAAIGPAEVDLDNGTTGLVLPEDAEPAVEPAPRAALLPALDPTPMGWTNRDWFLDAVGDRRADLFDRSGNIGPTVWWRGQVIGGWAQRADGEIALELLADTGREAGKAARSAAEKLTADLGDIRVTPRFRTPLERSLAG